MRMAPGIIRTSAAGRSHEWPHKRIPRTARTILEAKEHDVSKKVKLEEQWKGLLGA